MVADAVEALGGLDILVNNAGIAGPTAPVDQADPDQWEAVSAVDVVGTFHVTRHAIPHLKKSPAGSIVIMSSLGGRFGYPNRSAYCTAKMGLIGFAKTLARELGEFNIRCNAIAPGAVGGERMDRVLKGRTDSEGTTVEEQQEAAHENPIPQALRRPEGYRGPHRLPDVGCREVDLWPGHPDRQRRADLLSLIRRTRAAIASRPPPG